MSILDVYMLSLYTDQPDQVHLFVKAFVFMLGWCAFVQLEQVNSCSSFSSSSLTFNVEVY